MLIDIFVEVFFEPIFCDDSPLLRSLPGKIVFGTELVVVGVVVDGCDDDDTGDRVIQTARTMMMMIV